MGLSMPFEERNFPFPGFPSGLGSKDRRQVSGAQYNLRKGSEGNARSEKPQKEEPNLPTDSQGKQSYEEIMRPLFPGRLR